MQSNNIPIYTSKDFEGMRKAGSLAAKILDQLKSLIKPCLLYTSPSPRDS